MHTCRYRHRGPVNRSDSAKRVRCLLRQVAIMYPNGRRYTNVELAYPDVMDGKKADHSHDHPLPAPQLAPVVAVAAEAEAVTAEAEAEAAKAVLNDTAPAEVLTRARDCHYHRESVIATERLLLPPRDGYYHLKTVIIT